MELKEAEEKIRTLEYAIKHLEKCLEEEKKRCSYNGYLEECHKRAELQNNWNELKEWLEILIKENDTTIKKCDQVIFKMSNENRKDTHQHKLIDVRSRESLVFNRILSKMQEIEGGVDNEETNNN